MNIKYDGTDSDFIKYALLTILGAFVVAVIPYILYFLLIIICN